MRSLFLAAALLGGLVGNICSPSQDTFLDQHEETTPGAPSGLCDVAVDHFNVDVEGGTSGGRGEVGTPLVFSAQALLSSGAAVPDNCKPDTVAVTAIGSCSAAPQQPPDSIVALPTAAGKCRIQASSGDAIGTSDDITIDEAQVGDASWEIQCHRKSWLKWWPWPPASTCQDPPQGAA